VPVPPVFLEGDADDLSADPGDWATDQTMSPTAEGAALVGTQMPDLSATPFSAENMSAPKGEGSALAPRPWLIVAVLCALSAIAGLIGLIGYLLLDE
jgi:hypothetical protein